MDKQSLRTRYAELKAQVHFHNHRYHVLDAPIISDAEYDKLMNELKRIEAGHPDWVTADSPTQRAGARPADRFGKVRRPAPTLSLANALGDEIAGLVRGKFLKWRVYIIELGTDARPLVFQFIQFGTVMRAVHHADPVADID